MTNSPAPALFRHANSTTTVFMDFSRNGTSPSYILPRAASLIQTTHGMTSLVSYFESARDFNAEGVTIRIIRGDIVVKKKTAHEEPEDSNGERKEKRRSRKNIKKPSRK
ncbi:hypothetical protein AX16_001512 [Volvariella volvacea WC 439]|nr:hypothetical protein AX16_001512 [Volvariella volvacea WC 439]